jgi:hypothetical protein
MEWTALKTILDNTAAVSAIVAAVTVVRWYVAYRKQNMFRRFEKYSELSVGWFQDKNVQEIIKLLDDDPGHKLRNLPFERKEAFVGVYEEIAIMLYSGLLKKHIAFYMFGYYTVRCYENKDFWYNLDQKKYYWSLFRRFAEEMKQMEAAILTGDDHPDKWAFKF